MKCMYSQRFVCAKVHFGNKIYICNIFRTCADDQTIRPCFQISEYTHSFYTVTVLRLPSLGYQNIIPIICTSAIATAIQLHASNFNEPTHVERSVFFVLKLESNHEIRSDLERISFLFMLSEEWWVSQSFLNDMNALILCELWLYILVSTSRFLMQLHLIFLCNQNILTPIWMH